MFNLEVLNWDKGSVKVAQVVKNLPGMRETWVWLLGQEDPLEKGMATHSYILVWRNPQTETDSLVGYSPRGQKGSNTTEGLHNWGKNLIT